MGRGSTLIFYRMFNMTLFATMLLAYIGANYSLRNVGLASANSGSLNESR